MHTMAGPIYQSDLVFNCVDIIRQPERQVVQVTNKWQMIEMPPDTK